MSFVNILIKIVLIIFYYKLSREKQDKGFLALKEEPSLNEINEEDYVP